MAYQRAHERAHDQVRHLSLTYDAFGYADGSVLITLGETKVLCTVTMQPQVPPFLKGKKVGWLNAEYALLPHATQQRVQRAVTACKTNGRSVEIARLIGRSLRTITALNEIGERTIVIDCDVLQADGGTRTAAIFGAYIALLRAQKKWIAQQQIKKPVVMDAIGAISVGLLQGQLLLDLDFDEDSNVDADFNFVLTRSGDIIEVQGTAEKNKISWQQFEGMKQLALDGIAQLFKQAALTDEKADEQDQTNGQLFNLANRLRMKAVD